MILKVLPSPFLLNLVFLSFLRTKLSELKGVTARKIGTENWFQS